jgi:hypothetical protein
MFIEVILAKTEVEFSEVRYADEQLQWFKSHAAALQFAASYAATLEQTQKKKAFVSVCRPDGTWVPLHDVVPGAAGLV